MEKRGLRDVIEDISTKFSPKQGVLTVKEVAEYLNVSEACVYRYINYPRNPLPHIRLGRGKIMIPIPELARFMLG